MFDCCLLMGNAKSPNVSDFERANKVLQKVLSQEVKLRFPRLPCMEHLVFKVYSDASFGNLNGGGSQGGFVIFLCDAEVSKAIPLHWRSLRVKRVVKSTLAAETLALVDAAESCFWLQKLYEEMTETVGSSIICYTDNESLYKTVYLTTSDTDKRLQIDISILREILSNGEISKVNWVNTKFQLADCLTKIGAPSDNLIATLMDGVLSQ